jgi:hypothetical protein
MEGLLAASILSGVAVVLAVAALAWCSGLARRMREVTAVRGELAKMAAEGDVVRMAGVIDTRIGALERADERLRMDDSAIAERLGCAVRHVGLVRFDALPGLAGMFSFSLALLDDARDGVVMTSIYGRSDSRLYAKPLAEGLSDIPLTDEEGAAIARALGERETGAAGSSRRG